MNDINMYMTMMKKKNWKEGFIFLSNERIQKVYRNTARHNILEKEFRILMRKRKDLAFFLFYQFNRLTMGLLEEQEEEKCLCPPSFRRI